ncbi:MICOS complex subunit MIC27 isoform X2 [Erpetoichthys calabaricus]|uniref:MICOS complex subunit MIC27 isoform X2 n=1 Tax=Erpetoichthys calabaricus TaxID=27687 RepID=UPI0010A03064|nr:MICOS complex subunit MIC27 isoform X2 [Erpetoichthys calabaricus]
MATKAMKIVAVPTLFGFSSLRVYAAEEEKKENCVSTQELSVYLAPPAKLKYVEEQPGQLQSGISVAREAISPYFRSLKRGYDSLKKGVINIIHFGEDTYTYLKDPPHGFLPRVSVITVSGLAGLIMARKGSRFKKIMFPLGLAAAGTAVCYPAQAVTAVKITGKNAYSAGIWASGALSSLWKPKVSARPENKESCSLFQLQSTSDPANAAKSDVYQMTETTEVPASPKIGSLFPEDGSSLSQDTASSNLVPLPNSPPQTESFPAQKSFQEIVPSTVSPHSVVQSDVTEKPKYSPDPRLADHGQSNPEDADMYTTRS